MDRFAALAKRLGFALGVLLAVTLLTFCVTCFAPGDPARRIAGPQASAEVVERVRADLGLDRPVWLQYGAYVSRLVRLDLGVSNVTGRPVLTEILARAPASIELMGLGLLLSLAIGAPLGVAAALKRGGFADRLTSAAAVIGASTPAFWLGLILIVVFYRLLYWFPASGRLSGAPPVTLTGFLLVDSLLSFDFRAFADALAHLVLPAVSLALLDFGYFARLVRNQLFGVLDQDFIRVARASGLPETEVVTRHALPHALSPLVTVVAAALGGLLYGSVSIETVFGWPGAGKFVVDSIFALDFPVIMGFAVLASVVFVAINALADMLYGALDPRVGRR